MPELPFVTRDPATQQNFDALNKRTGTLEGRFPVVAADLSAEAKALAEPWLIEVNPFLTPATQTNWSELLKDDSQLMNGYLRSTGAQNAEIGWDVLLSAGTWTFSLLAIGVSDGGIATVSLDGNSIGTIDTYSKEVAYNLLKTITGATVATTGKKRLLLKMATKNASSTAYRCDISAVGLRRTK